MPSPRAQRRATPDLAPEIVSRLVRGGLVTLGGLIVVAGVLIAPIPGPGGVPVIAVGLVVILRNSYKAKKVFVRAHRRWPRAVHPLRRLMRKEPEIASVFWQQYLRVERFALPKRYRVGVKGRHFVKRHFGGSEA
ncbi:hypothetical protein [Phenylobacterium sp.]|jgi:UDP-N-acetylmuramyl pentapeptide phosphotransferase/UDP-N-acetylglucosamine-1-phosphate transferase|uniref:hypothetical protein n=1 Tax=Phenylobacterium sp. TaxID=1871053 RepID=UPI002F94E21F